MRIILLTAALLAATLASPAHAVEDTDFVLMGMFTPTITITPESGEQHVETPRTYVVIINGMTFGSDIVACGKARKEARDLAPAIVENAKAAAVATAKRNLAEKGVKASVVADASWSIECTPYSMAIASGADPID